MNKTRLWVLGTVLMSIIVLALGWFLGVSPKLADTLEATGSRIIVDAQNAVYEEQLAELKMQFAQIGNLKGQLASVREAVPTEAEMPTFLRQMHLIAVQNRVTVVGVAVKDGMPYLPVAAVADGGEAPAPTEGTAPAPDDTPAQPTEGSNAAPSGSGAPAASAQALVAEVAGGPAATLISAENFVAVPVDLKVTGSYADLLAFIDGMQNGNRLVSVTDITTTAESDTARAEIALLVYVLTDPKPGALSEE